MKKGAVLFLILSILCTALALSSAKAMGPDNSADNNPNVTLQGTTCDLTTGSESSNRWLDTSTVTSQNAYRLRDFTQYRGATHGEVDGGIKGAEVVLTVFGPWDGYTKSFFTTLYTHDDLALQYENKWVYMSSDYVYQWFKATGMPDAEASNFAYVLWPYGVYYRYIDVR